MTFYWEEGAFCIDVDFESSEEFGVLNANKANQLNKKKEPQKVSKTYEE